MYEGIRKRLGLENTDCSQILYELTDQRSIREELERLIGVEVVTLWHYGGSGAHEPDFEGATFRKGVLETIEGILFFEGGGFGCGLNNLYDVVPVSSLQKGSGELKFYHFIGNFHNDQFEYVSIIEQNPVAAAMGAWKKGCSSRIQLRKVEELKPGIIFKWER